MSGTSEKRRRGGGRAGNAKRRSASKINQMPWHLPINCDPPIAPLTNQGVEAIHEGVMRILEEIGIEFLHPEACSILQQAGCTVRGTNVRVDRHFVMDMVSKAPSQWTITPRKPDRCPALLDVLRSAE